MRRIIIFLISIIFLIICSFEKIYALDNIPIRKHRFPNTYAVFDGIDRVHLFYAQSYSFDGNIAYCIEPGIPISSDSYSSTDNLGITNLDNDTLNKIRLIAYYGFAYNIGPHLNDHYYMASQEMIWKEITGRDTYWVSEEDVNGPRINIDNEKRVISKLVADHYTLPSFNNQEIILKLGDEFILKDDNQVLDKFELYEEYDNVKIVGNTIKIEADSLDFNQEIKLVKKSYTDKVSLIYYSGNSQKLMSSTGVLEPLLASFKVKTIPDVKIKIVKVDAITKERIKLSGIKFKIKNIDTNKYICDTDDCVYETNSNGEFITNSTFGYGNYEIIEVSNFVPGYLVNKDSLKFSINSDSRFLVNDNDTYLEIKFENMPILGKIVINKLGEKVNIKNDLYTYYFDQISGVMFDLYAGENIYTGTNNLKYHQDELVTKVEIKNGSASISNLPLGKYYLIESKTLDNYVIDKSKHDVVLTQKDNDEVIYTISLKNYLKKGTFELTKIDKTTKLPLRGAVINLYNDLNELIYQDTTNDNGVFMVEGLPLGTYYYTEVLAPDDYLIDSSKHYFELSEDNQNYNANLVNERVDVPSTNRNRNYLLDMFSFISFLIGGVLFGFNKKY